MGQNSEVCQLTAPPLPPPEFLVFFSWIYFGGVRQKSKVELVLFPSRGATFLLSRKENLVILVDLVCSVVLVFSTGMVLEAEKWIITFALINEILCSYCIFMAALTEQSLTNTTLSKHTRHDVCAAINREASIQVESCRFGFRLSSGSFLKIFSYKT